MRNYVIKFEGYKDTSIVKDPYSIDGLLLNVGSQIKRDGFDFAANTLLAVPIWESLACRVGDSSPRRHNEITGYGFTALDHWDIFNTIKRNGTVRSNTDGMVVFYRSGLVEVEATPFNTEFTVSFSVDLSNKQGISVEQIDDVDFIYDAWTSVGKRKPVYERACRDIEQQDKDSLRYPYADSLSHIAASPETFAEAIQCGVPIEDIVA